MKKIAAELIPLPNQVSTVVWNAWRHRKVGGSISVGVRSVAHRCAATVLRASMRPSMRRDGHPIIASSEQAGF